MFNVMFYEAIFYNFHELKEYEISKSQIINIITFNNSTIVGSYSLAVGTKSYNGRNPKS